MYVVCVILRHTLPDTAKSGSGVGSGMGRYGNLDCPTLTGRGFPLGLSMLLVGTAGEAGEAFLPALVGLLPPREDALLLDLEMFGLVVAFLSPGLFGFALPRTE